jgi:hypothetical protein
MEEGERRRRKRRRKCTLMAPLELLADVMLSTVAQRSFKCDCSLGRLASFTRASG